MIDNPNYTMSELETCLTAQPGRLAPAGGPLSSSKKQNQSKILIPQPKT